MVPNPNLLLLRESVDLADTCNNLCNEGLTHVFFIKKLLEYICIVSSNVLPFQDIIYMGSLSASVFYVAIYILRKIRTGVKVMLQLGGQNMDILH